MLKPESTGMMWTPPPHTHTRTHTHMHTHTALLSLGNAAEFSVHFPNWASRVLLGVHSINPSPVDRGSPFQPFSVDNGSMKDPRAYNPLREGGRRGPKEHRLWHRAL